MPKRTTEFQTIVHFVRKQTAAAGVTVTESRMLRDSHLDVDREVDIVIEGTFDSEPSVTSIEVIEHSRPASVTWVEQQIARFPGLLEVTPPADWVDQEVEDGILHVAQSGGGDDAAPIE